MSPPCSLLLAGAAAPGAVRAADSQELWPELDVFKRLSPEVRLFFLAGYTTALDTDAQSLELDGYVDITLRPLLRSSFPEGEDWRTNKYLWARVGYAHIEGESSGQRKPEENRGVLALYLRAFLPAQVVLEGRGRFDLRWIGGDYSTRYRLRGEVNREFAVLGHAVVPYFQAEAFYDTRYDGWARQLYQPGAEFEIVGPFRIELYVAWQVDRLPSSSTTQAFGIIGKFYL